MEGELESPILESTEKEQNSNSTLIEKKGSIMTSEKKTLLTDLNSKVTKIREETRLNFFSAKCCSVDHCKTVSVVHMLYSSVSKPKTCDNFQPQKISTSLSNEEINKHEKSESFFFFLFSSFGLLVQRLENGCLYLGVSSFWGNIFFWKGIGITSSLTLFIEWTLQFVMRGLGS